VAPSWVGGLRELERGLRGVASRRRAAAEKAYLKSSNTFFGNTVPQLRRATRRLVRDHPNPTREELRSVVESLWAGRVHERWTVGLMLLEAYPGTLGRRDLPFVRRLMRRGGWWNFVDVLGVHVAGPIVARQDADGRMMERWSRDRDLWVRRGALLALLPGLKDGRIRFGVFERIAVPRLSERDFFMRKALGWILREVGKSDPDSVTTFLRRNFATLSALTRREAVKYLPTSPRRAPYRFVAGGVRPNTVR
jgi:3-methyladenine DNA glycosylase AlkD